MPQWMRDLVIGMSVSESKEGLSFPDADASDEEKARFTPKKVKVTINHILEAILPQVDDDLAIKVGAESADIMRERLKVLMEKQAKEAQQTSYREQLSGYLLENIDFEVPGSLLYTEIHHRSKQLFSSPSFKTHLDSLSEEEKKEEFKKIENQAKDALKLFYICRKVLTDNHITLGAEDLTQDIQSPLDAMFADSDLANPNKTEDQKNLLMSKILLIKAQDFILDKILKQ
jgi:trigger factor